MPRTEKSGSRIEFHPDRGGNQTPQLRRRLGDLPIEFQFVILRSLRRVKRGTKRMIRRVRRGRGMTRGPRCCDGGWIMGFPRSCVGGDCRLHANSGFHLTFRPGPRRRDGQARAIILTIPLHRPLRTKCCPCGQFAMAFHLQRPAPMRGDESAVSHGVKNLDEPPQSSCMTLPCAVMSCQS